MGKRLKNRVLNALMGMFDRVAPSHDLLNHLFSLGMDFSWRRRAVECLHILHIRDGDLIDIATATGDLAFVALKGENAPLRGSISHT